MPQHTAQSGKPLLSVVEADTYNFDPFFCQFRYVENSLGDPVQAYVYVGIQSNKPYDTETLKLLETVSGAFYQEHPCSWYQVVGSVAIIGLNDVQPELSVVDWLRKRFITEKLSK